MVDTGLWATTSSPRRTSSPDPSLTMTSLWVGTTSGSTGRVEVGGGVLDIGAVLLHAMLENFTGLVELEHLWSQPGVLGETAGLERFRRIEAAARQEAMLREPAMAKAMVRANGRTN